jgi:hypothetical protein
MAQGHIATLEIGFFGSILRGRYRIGVRAMLGGDIQYVQAARDSSSDHCHVTGVVLEETPDVVRASALGDGISRHDPV